MPSRSCGNYVVCATTFFLLGWAFATHHSSTARAQQAPKEANPPPAFTMQHRVGANLYLQNAPEYRACCLGIYKSAELRMCGLLDAARSKPAKPAVVLDLDETVFDNSAFQTFLYKSQKEYSDEYRKCK